MTFRNPNSAEPTDTSPQPEASPGGTDRMAALAEAFGMDGRVGGALSAQSAAETFSEATLTLARAQPAFVKEVEAVRSTCCIRCCLFCRLELRPLATSCRQSSHLEVHMCNFARSNLRAGC